MTDRHTDRQRGRGGGGGAVEKRDTYMRIVEIKVVVLVLESFVLSMSETLRKSKSRPGKTRQQDSSRIKSE